MTKRLFIRLGWMYAAMLLFTGLLVAASAGAAPTSLASGTLDSGFGKGGRVITRFGMPASGASAVLVQPDGKIVAAGVPGNNRGFALVRYRRNGSLDPTFGSHGKVTTSFSPDRGDATSLARQPDGKIVAGGSGYDSSVGWIVLARYGRTGRLDAGFGTGGIVQTRFSDSKTDSVGASDVVLQPDGKIVAVGDHVTLEGVTVHDDIVLVGYLRDGTLDTSFGAGGKVTTATDTGAGSVALQRDGKIVVAGSNGSSSSSQASSTVARYNTDGSLDQTFGSAGIVKTTPGSFRGAAAVLVQRSGKIVVVGAAGTRRSLFALARFNRDGTPDSSFGFRGIVKVGFGPGSSAEATAGARQRDGRIVVVGWYNRYPKWEFAVARFRANGSLDPSFGVGGRITTSFRSAAPKTSRQRQDEANAVAIQPNGKIVVAGHGGLSPRGWERTRTDFELARYIGR